MSETTSQRQTVVVIPCSGDKLDHAAAARDLYTGTMFRRALEVATSDAFDADLVLILSAKYGLVELDQVIDTYQVKMGQAGSVTAATVADQAANLGIIWDNRPEVYALLPKAYFAVLDEALRSDDLYPIDVYEDCGGVGWHRQVLRTAIAA